MLIYTLCFKEVVISVINPLLPKVYANKSKCVVDVLTSLYGRILIENTLSVIFNLIQNIA